MGIGFIQDKLEIKFLILYIAARVTEPLAPAAMQDLTMCDDGIDYFDYAECLNDLVKTEHLRMTEDGRYVITEKGLKNSQICESSLPLSVRQRSDRNIAAYNKAALRRAQVQSHVTERPNGTYTVTLALRDDVDQLMELQLMVADRPTADALAQQQAHHRQVRHGVRRRQRLRGIIEKKAPRQCRGAFALLFLLFTGILGLAVHANGRLAVDSAVVVDLIHTLLTLQGLFFLLGLLGGGFFVCLLLLAVGCLFGVLHKVLVLFRVAGPVDTIDRQADQQGSAYDDNAVKKNIPEHRRTSCTSFYQYTPKDGCLQEICSRAEGKGAEKCCHLQGESV